MLTATASTGRPHQSPACKRHISGQQQALIQLAANLCYGTIFDVPWRGHEPVLDPMPRRVKRIKIGARNLPVPQAQHSDFTLKEEWIEFFRTIDALGDGIIIKLEIVSGLPFLYEFESISPS